MMHCDAMQCEVRQGKSRQDKARQGGVGQDEVRFLYTMAQKQRDDKATNSIIYVY